MRNEYPVDINTGYEVMTVHNKAEADFAWRRICQYYIEMAERLHRDQRKVASNG